MTTKAHFKKHGIEKFAGSKFIHVVEVASEIGITPQAFLERSLTYGFPLYVTHEKGWKLGLVSGEPVPYNEECAATPSYSHLKLNSDDVAMLFANKVAEISNFMTEDNCHVRVLGNGFTPAKTLTITIDKLIVMYNDLAATADSPQLGVTEKESLLKSITALAYTASYFYEKAFEDGKLGKSPKIIVSPLVAEVHKHLSEMGYSLSGISSSSLEARISDGMKLLKKE